MWPHHPDGLSPTARGAGCAGDEFGDERYFRSRGLEGDLPITKKWAPEVWVEENLPNSQLVALYRIVLNEHRVPVIAELRICTMYCFNGDRYELTENRIRAQDIRNVKLGNWYVHKAVQELAGNAES
jgi:hypothetical protein